MRPFSWLMRAWGISFDSTSVQFNPFLNTSNAVNRVCHLSSQLQAWKQNRETFQRIVRFAKLVCQSAAVSGGLNTLHRETTTVLSYHSNSSRFLVCLCTGVVDFSNLSDRTRCVDSSILQVSRRMAGKQADRLWSVQLGRWHQVWRWMGQGYNARLRQSSLPNWRFQRRTICREQICRCWAGLPCRVCHLFSWGGPWCSKKSSKVQPRPKMDALKHIVWKHDCQEISLPFFVLQTAAWCWDAQSYWLTHFG